MPAPTGGYDDFETRWRINRTLTLYGYRQLEGVSGRVCQAPDEAWPHKIDCMGYEDGARHFAEWLHRSDIAVGDIDECVVTRFSQHHCRCGGYRRQLRLSAKYVSHVRRFVGFWLIMTSQGSPN